MGKVANVEYAARCSLVTVQGVLSKIIITLVTTYSMWPNALGVGLV